MVTVAAAAMLVGCVRAHALEVVGARLARFVVAAVGSGVVTRLLADAMPTGDGRPLLLAVVALSAGVGILAYVGAAFVLGERSVPRLVGNDA